VPVNALLVRWTGGWDEVADETSIGRWGRREATLGLGAEQDLAEVQRVARAQLTTLANPRTEIATEPLPVDEADTPWLAYRVGDYIGAPDWNAGPAAQRVLSMGGSLDADGRLTYSVELKDRIVGDRERIEQTQKKMTNGTLRGASKVATPVAAIGKRNIPPPAPPPEPPVCA